MPDELTIKHLPFRGSQAICEEPLPNLTRSVGEWTELSSYEQCSTCFIKTVKFNA